MSDLRVKLDENLGLVHAAQVRAAGYQCDRVTDEGLSGSRDEIVWQQVLSEGRFFVTLDLDFSDVRSHPPGSHHGVLLIRAESSDRDTAAQILDRVLASHDLADLKGCLVVADAAKTRVRSPPEPR